MAIEKLTECSERSKRAGVNWIDIREVGLHCRRRRRFLHRQQRYCIFWQSFMKYTAKRFYSWCCVELFSSKPIKILLSFVVPSPLPWLPWENLSWFVVLVVTTSYSNSNKAVHVDAGSWLLDVWQIRWCSNGCLIIHDSFIAEDNIVDRRMTLQWCVLHYEVAGEKCYLL